jgi:circadian clock protein KaiB
MSRPVLHVRLYVAGDALNSTCAVSSLRSLLARHASRPATVEIIDILKHPEQGMRDGVLVTPTLIKLAPRPERRLIGNLKDTHALATALGLGEP